MVWQEDGDELVSSIGQDAGDKHEPPSTFPVASAGNDESDAIWKLAHDPLAVTENEVDGYHYAQEEWDQYNAEHGGQRGVAPPSAPTYGSADDASATSSTGAIDGHQASPETVRTPGITPEDGHETENDDASLGDIGGGEEHEVRRESASDDAVQREPDVHGEKETAIPSSAADVAATNAGDDADDVDVIGRRKRQQQQQSQQEREEESDDLYDIDDHGLSSSDDE